jgi:hypothetical protein
LAVVLVGMGDFTIDGRTPEVARTGMQTIAGNLNTNGWEGIILTYFPKEDDATNTLKCRTFNQYIREDAATYGYKVMETWDMFVDPDNDLDANPIYYFPGSTVPTHPNSTGHAMIEARLREYIYPIGRQMFGTFQKLSAERRLDLLNVDRSILMDLRHNNTSGYLENFKGSLTVTSTGSLLFNSANATVNLDSRVLLKTSLPAAGINVLDIVGDTTAANFGLRIAPGTAGSAYTLFNLPMKATFEISPDTAFAERWVFFAASSTSATSGWMQVSRGTSPRDFTWAYATSASNRTDLMRLTVSSTLGVGTTTPAFGVHAANGTATSSIGAGVAGTKTGCIVLQDTDKAGFSYCTALDGTLTCSSVSCL